MTQSIAQQPATIRERLSVLEAEMKKYPQTVIPVRHYFADGLYAREITVLRGTLLTGKVHLTQHLNIISQGEISVLTEEGPKRLKAPCTLVSQPGMKRAGYVHEDCVWTTIHANPTNEHNIERLEDLLVVDTYEQFLALCQEAACPLLPQP